MANKPDIGIAAARGVFWIGGGQIARQLVQLATSLIFARLLVPDDFGLLGMAIVFTGVAQLFADFGIGAAIVQSRNLERVAFSSCFWANVAVAAVLVLAIVLAAPLIAGFYADPRVAPVVAVLAFGLLISGLIVVPRAILYKNLHFAELAKAQFFGSLFGAIVAVLLAWRGFGVWSLIIQPLAGSMVTLALTVRYAKWLPRLEFSWASIRDLATFSANVLGTDLLNYANRNADSALIGKFLGSSQLGYYSLAYQIMLYPLSQVAGVIMRVLFPALSQMQDEQARFRNAYLKSVAAIGVVTFPMMIGLFAVAHDFVVVVFGEKWLPMLPVLKILCLVGMVQSVGTTVGTLFLSTGKVRTLFYLTLTMTPAVIAAFAIGLRWGIEGVAAGYAIVSMSFFYLSLTVAFRAAGLKIVDFHLSIMRPMAASLVMGAVVYCGGVFLQDAGLTPTVRLVTMIALGAGAYAALSWLINREQITELVRVGISAFGRKK